MLGILLAKTVSNSSISYLETLIEDHHQTYCKLFEDTLKPKFHLLVHYPRIMRKIGPARYIWVMRYEGFHKQVKSTAKIVTSRINLLLTLCIKQQLKFSNRILNRKGLSNPIQFGQCFGQLHDIKDMKLISFLTSCKSIFSEKAIVISSIKIDNIKYNLRNALQINDTESDCLLKFGLLQYIIIDDKIISFILLPLTTTSFQSHFQGYEILINENAHWFCLNWENLPNKFPYNIHIIGNGKNFIVPLQ